MAGSARLGPSAVVRGVERLGAVALSPARDWAAPGAGDAGADRGGSVPPLPQPVVCRPARALPRAGVAGPYVLGARAVPGRGAARPLGRDQARGAVPARAVRGAVRRLHAPGSSLAVSYMRKSRCAGIDTVARTRATRSASTGRRCARAASATW